MPIIYIEGLLPETDITSIYRKLPLVDDAEKTGNVELEMAQNPKEYINMQQYVIDAGFGFNMDVTTKYTENYYLNRWGEN